MGAASSTSLRVQPGPPESDGTPCGSTAVEATAALPPACEDYNWLKVGLSTLVGTGDELAGIGAGDFGRALAERRDSSNVRENQGARSSQVGAASVGSCDEEDDWLEATLCLSVSSLSREEMALVVARVRQKLFKNLSYLCSQDDSFCEVVMQRIHVMQCVHAAMSRQRRMQLETDDELTNTQPNTVVDQESMAGLSEDNTSSSAAVSGDQLLGLQLFFSLLEFVRDPECSQEQLTDFLQQIAPVLSSLPPLCLAGRYSDSPGGVRSNQTMPWTPAPCVVDSLRRFLATLALEDKVDDNFPRKGDELSIGKHPSSDPGRRGVALSAMISLVAARGRAGDILLLVKVLISARHRTVNAVEGLQDDDEANSVPGETVLREEHVLADCSAKRRPTSRTKARTSRQGLPIDDDDGDDDEGLVDATVLAHPAFDMVVGPAVPVTGGDVAGDPWKGITLGHSSGQGEGGEPLDTHPVKARKLKGERAKQTPPIALEPEPWKRVEHTSNEHNSATDPSVAVGFVYDDADGVEAKDILPLLRQLHAAKPNGDLGPGKVGPVHEQEMWTCGQNSYGELGHSDTGTRKVHCLVKTFADREVIDVAAGNEHTVLLCRTGEVFTAGYNDNGQCGQGATQRVGVLTCVPNLAGRRAVQVHAYNGCEHTLVVLDDGQLVSFGYNYRGQLGHGNTSSEPVPKPVRGLDGIRVTQVSCSYYHSVIACDNGEVYAFGRNDFGQLASGDTIDRKLPSLVESLRDQRVTSLACGQYHTVVSTLEVGVQSCGKNDYGQLGVEPTGFQINLVIVKGALDGATVRHLRCGYYHTIVLMAGERVLGFGRNDYGQLGLGHITQRVFGPKVIEGAEGKGISKVSAGCYHTVLVGSDGMLYVFGRNHHGQLGTGDTNERHSPFPVDTFLGKRIAKVAAGFYHTIVLTGGGQDEETSKLGSRGTTERYSPRSILTHPALMLPRDASSGETTAEAAKENTDNFAVEIMSPEMSSPVCNRGSPGDSGGSPTIKLCEDGDPRMEYRTGRGICHGDGRVSGRKAAVVIMAHMDRLADSYAALEGGVPVIGSTGTTPASRKASCPRDQRGNRSDEENVRSNRDAYCVDISPHTFELLDAILVAITEDELFIDPVEEAHFQVYMLLAALRILKANLARLLQSPVSTRIITSTLAHATSFDLDDENELQAMGRTGHDPDLYTLLFDASADGHVIVDDHATPVITSHEGPDQYADADARDKGNGENAGDVRLRSEAERYCNVLCCLQRRLLLLVQSGPFCHGGAGVGVELVQREAATVLILGLELFFTGQAKQFRLLSTLLNTAGVDDDDERELSVGGECDSIERSMGGPRAARHFILVPLLRRFCDDALASKLIPYGADADKGSSVCSVVKVTDPSLRGYRVTAASPRLLEMQVALLVDLIAQGNPCAISSEEAFADDEQAAAFMPTRQEGSPFSVLQLNGSATNRTESFGLESNSVSKPIVDRSNDASRTQRLYVEVILTLTKHMMHWAASDRITVDPGLWQSRVMGDLCIHEREAEALLLEKDASIKTSGWFATRTKGLCDRAASVVLDGLDRTPSSWRCLIKHAHLILKHSTAILEAALERETQSHDESGEGDAESDTRQLDRLEHTLVGLLLPAVITGLLPFAQIPVFARRLLDVVNATVVLMDEACYKCSGIRRADADYVAARNGDTEAVAVKRKPQTLFVRGENGKLGAGGTAGRCSNGKSSPLEAETGRKSPVRARHNSHNLPWLLSLAKTTALLAGQLSATLVVGDCGISPILESFARSPVYSSWMESDLLAGGCDPSYEWLMVAPLDAANNDGSADRGVSVVVTAPVDPANSGLVRTSDPAVPREKLDQFLQGVANGCDQGGRFAAWLSEAHAPTDAAYRLIKRQAAAGRDGEALERAERSMLAAMLKHGGLDGDAALFSSRFEFERGCDSLKGYSRKPPRMFALLSKRMAEMVGWLWHSRSKLKSSDTSQSTVAALLEEAADACLTLIMFRPVAVVPPAFAPERQGASRGPLSLLQVAARRRWRKVAAAIRAMIRWRSVVSGRFSTEASGIVPRFMRAMLRSKANPAAPEELSRGDGEVSCGEFSAGCLSVLLILVLDNHQRAVARTCGLRSFRTLVGMVRTPSLLADVLLPLAPAMQTPRLVDRHILTHLSTVGRSVTLGVTAAFQALICELLRLAEESCLSQKRDEGVALVTSVNERMPTRSEVGHSNGCNYPVPRLFDVRTVLVMLEFLGLSVRPQDWGFMEAAGIIRIVSLVAAAPLGMDGDSSTKDGADVDTSGRADSTREHEAALSRGHASQPSKKSSLAATPDRIHRSFSTCRAAAWTLFRALIVQLHPVASITRIAGTTSPQVTSIMEVLHKELTKCVGKAQAISGDVSSGSRRGGCRWDGEESKHRDRTPSQAILEFAPPLIGGFPNSPAHAQAASGVKMYGAGASHKRRCQELVSSPCRLMNMEDGLVFPAEHVLNNPRGSDFSITFWLLLAQDQTGHHRTVLARGHGSERWPVVLLRNTDNRLEVCFGIPSMGNLCERLTSKEPIQVNTWTHVGLISEHNKLRLYFNGALDCQRTSTGALRANRHPLYVGKVPDGTMRLDGVRGGVEGSIASLRYFTRALSPIHVRIICDPGPPEPAKVEDWHLYQLCACLVPISRSPQCRRHLQHPAWLKLVLQAFTHGTLRVQQAVCRLLREILPYVPPSVMATVALGTPGLRTAPLPLAPGTEGNEGGGDLQTAFTAYLLRLVGASLWYTGAKTSAVNAVMGGSHEGKSEEECEATVAQILLREQVMRFVPLTIAPSCLRGGQASAESVRNNNGSDAGGSLDTAAEGTAAVRNPTSALSPETTHGISMIGAELVALVQTLAATEAWGTATSLALRQSLAHLTRFIDATGELPFPKETDGLDVAHESIITAEGRLTVAGGEAALHVLGGAIDFLCAGARARVRETNQRCIVLSADQATSTVHVILHPEDRSALDKWVQRFGAHDLEVENSDSLSRGAMVAFSDNTSTALPENGSVPTYEYISEVMAAFLRTAPLPRSRCVSGRALQKPAETAYREIVLAQSRSCLARVVLRASRNRHWATSAVETCDLFTELVRVSVLPRSTTSGILSDESIAEMEAIAIQARLHQMLGMPGGGDIVTGKIMEMAVNPGKASFLEKDRDLDGGEGNNSRQERNGANRRSSISSTEGAMLDGMACPFCHETKSTVSGMVEHVLTKHSSDMRRMPCPICVAEKGDTAVHDLPTHLELVHLDAVLRGRRSLLPAFGEQRREAGGRGSEARAPSHLVDQLMVIGFPEEWCTMALRENDNDVVNASAWIVDNLDMLSSLNSLSASPADDTGEGHGSPPRVHVESSGRPWQVSHRFLQEGLGRREGRESVNNRANRGQQGELGGGGGREEKYGEEDELEGDNSDEEGEQHIGEREEEEDEGDEEEDEEEEGDNDEEEGSDDHADDEEGRGGGQREAFDSEEEDEEEDQEDETEDGNSRYSMHGIGRHQQVIVVPPSRPALNDALDGEHPEVAGNHRITDGLVVSGHRDIYFGMENSEAHTPGSSPHNTSNPSKGSQLAAVNSKIAGMELCQLTEVWLHTELQLTTLYCRAALVNILLRWPPHVPMGTASFGSPATVVKLIQSVLFSGQDLPITFAHDRHCDSILQPVSNGSQPPKVLGVFASLLVHLLHSERDACCSPGVPLDFGTETKTELEWDCALIEQVGGQNATTGDKGDWRNSLSARLVSDCLDGLDAAAGASTFADVPWIAMESSPSHRLAADMKSNLQLLQWLLDLLLSVSCADVFTENVFSRLSNCLNSPNVAAKEVAMYSLTSVATRWCEHLTADADQGRGNEAKPAPIPVALPSPLAMEETFQRHMTIPRVRSALVKRIAVERRPGGLFFTRYTQTLTALYVAMVKLQRLFLLRRRQMGRSKESAGADCAEFAEVSTPTILYSTDSSVALTWLPMRKAASTSSTTYEVQMAARQLGIKESQDVFRCVYAGKRLRCRVEDLMPGQVYRFRLRAVYSTAKTTAWSAVATAETEQGIAFRFDSANSGPAIFVSGNDLWASFGSNETWSTILGTTPFYTGSNYWEIQLDKSATTYLFIGVATRDADLTTFLGGDDHGWGFIGDRALYHKRTKVKAYGERFGQGDTIGVTLNMDRGTLSFSKNGHDLGVAFEGLVGGLYPAVAFYNQGQRLSLVPSAFRCPGAGVTILTSPLNTTPEDVSTVHEVMEAMVSRNMLPLAWMEATRTAHLAWVAGTTIRYATSLGFELQFDVSDSACRGFGMKARRRVRTPRGIATVIGICDGIMWFHVDGEPGAWFFTAGEIWEGRASGCFAMSPLDALGAERGGGWKMGGGIDEQITDQQSGADDTRVNNSPEVGHREKVVDADSDRSFGGDLAGVRDCAKWSPTVDGCIVAALCDHADRHQVSVWNFTPEEVLNILSPVRRRLESLLAGEAVADDALLCRVSVLKQLNHELVGVLPFADLAEGVQISGRAESRTFCWGSSSRHRGLAVGVGKHPTRGLGPLLVCLRQSIFLSTKEKTLSQSVNITTTHSKRAEDEYDYPEDLPQVTVNRLKAVAGQESPDIEARLRTSVFHQLYRELRDIDTSLLRMGYMHPMDDGQRRTFKVKFEGEGVDDYGGPYREIFTQVASELTSIISSSPTAGSAEQALGSTLHQLGQSLLPILEPTPSTRSDGGGDDVEAEFMVKANVQQQRYLRMYRFLGQLMGIALRCRVAAPWRLSRIFWKGLVGEALQEADLAHIDSTAHAFVKSIHERVASMKQTSPRGANEKADLATSSLEDFAVESVLKGMPEGSTRAVVARERIAGLGPGARGASSVKLSDLSLYVQEVAQAWLREGDRALFAVRDGFTSVVPSAALPLFTWEEIELQACGRPGVDVDLLERNTEYDDDMSPSDAHIQSFWRVLRAFDDRDRSQFLRFVWARSRLPSQTADFHQKFKIHSPTGDGAREDPDQYLPKAHTCFFSINLPRYSSDEVMAKKLSYTMYNCIEMDADFRLADNEMPGWESEAANRSAREQSGGDINRLE